MDPHFDGVIFQTHALELSRRLKRPFPPCVVLDVRDGEAFERGHLPGARRFSSEARANGLPEGAELAMELIVCGSGPVDERVRRASLVLRQLGARRIVEFQGGIDEWTSYGLPTEREVAA